MGHYSGGYEASEMDARLEKFQRKYAKLVRKHFPKPLDKHNPQDRDLMDQISSASNVFRMGLWEK